MTQVDFDESAVRQDQVEKVRDWLCSGRVARMDSINRRVTSYGLKHVIEREVGMYISNESCIEGFKACGYKAQRVRGTPNYRFNVYVYKTE